MLAPKFARQLFGRRRVFRRPAGASNFDFGVSPSPVTKMDDLDDDALLNIDELAITAQYEAQKEAAPPPPATTIPAAFGLAAPGVRAASYNSDGLVPTLQRYFGFECFRDGQEDVMRAILSGRDAAVFWATGNGKSLVYQVPALHTGKTSVVITPLISLMQDQVNKINATAGRGEEELAAFLGSAQSDQTVEWRALQGEFPLVYMSPEKLFAADGVVLHALARMAGEKKLLMLAVGRLQRPRILRIQRITHPPSRQPSFSTLRRHTPIQTRRTACPSGPRLPDGPGLIPRRAGRNSPSRRGNPLPQPLFVWVTCFSFTDEAQCVFEWGHDFRTEYLRLGEFRRAVPGVPIVALTATAVARVQADIIRSLGIIDPCISRQSFRRANLQLRCERKLGTGGISVHLAGLVRSYTYSKLLDSVLTTDPTWEMRGATKKKTRLLFRLSLFCEYKP